MVNDGNLGANYTYTFNTAAGTIDQRAITVTAAPDTKTYDGTTASTGTPTITAGSLATGDIDHRLHPGLRQPKCRTTLRSRPAASSTTATPEPTTPTLSTQPPERSIKLAITVTAAADTKTYDGTTASAGNPTITAGSLATGDVTTSFTQVFDSRNAGPRNLVASGIVNDGNGGANYSYSFNPAPGLIDQQAITVTAAGDVKTYDGTTNSMGVPLITGLLGAGDTPGFTQVFDSATRDREP